MSHILLGTNALTVLMGTKVDVAEKYPSKRQVRLEDAKSLAHLKHMIGVTETSAKEDKNITRTFVELGTRLRDKHERMESIQETERSIRLSTVSVNEVEERKCIC